VTRRRHLDDATAAAGTGAGRERAQTASSRLTSVVRLPKTDQRTWMSPRHDPKDGAEDRDPRDSPDLTGICNASVALHREHFGRGPGAARAYAFDDLVVCLLTDVLTRAEQTLVGAGEGNRVLEWRAVHQAAVKEAFRWFRSALQRAAWWTSTSTLGLLAAARPGFCAKTSLTFGGSAPPRRAVSRPTRRPTTVPSLALTLDSGGRHCRCLTLEGLGVFATVNAIAASLIDRRRGRPLLSPTLID
jgi:hypothetical protein